MPRRTKCNYCARNKAKNKVVILLNFSFGETFWIRRCNFARLKLVIITIDKRMCNIRKFPYSSKPILKINWNRKKRKRIEVLRAELIIIFPEYLLIIINLI